MEETTPHDSESMKKASKSSKQAPKDGLHLPLPVAYLSEAQLCEMLGCSVRAFRGRQASCRPPCIKLTPRRRVYDPNEVADWIASLPRSR